MPSFSLARLPDHVRGCLIGGAVGDAFGYAVEFLREPEIFARYGDGLRGIEDKWKTDLELYDVILTIADDLHEGEQVLQSGCRADADWYRRYVNFHK